MPGWVWPVRVRRRGEVAQQFRSFCQHRAGHRSSLSGALVAKPPQAGSSQDGCGRDLPSGKKQKFFTVVSNLETSEPLWFGQDRKKETLDEFLEKGLKVPFSAVRYRRPVWICGIRSVKAWSNGCRSAG